MLGKTRGTQGAPIEGRGHWGWGYRGRRRASKVILTLQNSGGARGREGCGPGVSRCEQKPGVSMGGGGRGVDREIQLSKCSDQLDLKTPLTTSLGVTTLSST